MRRMAGSECFLHLVGNEDILGFETVAENVFGQGIDEESHGPAGSLQEKIVGKLLIDCLSHLYH